MSVTIATHNGSRVAREHNIRNERVTSKEPHIEPNGVHEIWIDEKPRDAYERLFGEAVREYNEHQPRADRQIKNYYNSVENHQSKHPVYEMIIGVYGKNNGECSSEQGKEIMRDFVDSWKERNPNLELIGAYYHADEQGEPHVHLDYIPVAHGYIRGPETQTGLKKAFGEMGFEKQGKATAQIQWEKRENEYLESLCKERGLTVEHPQVGKGAKHLETEIYKLTKEKEDTEIDLERISGLKKKYEDINQAVEDKSFLGKGKGTVTLDIANFNALNRLAEQTKNIKEREKKLMEKQKRIDEAIDKARSSKQIPSVASELIDGDRYERQKQLNKLATEEMNKTLKANVDFYMLNENTHEYEPIEKLRGADYSELQQTLEAIKGEKLQEIKDDIYPALEAIKYLRNHEYEDIER